MFNRRSTLIILAMLLAPFALVGCSSNESGPIEAIDTAPPAAPVMTEARCSGNTATLHWARNTETDVAGYNVYFFTPDPGADESYTKLNTELVPGTWYTANGLQPETMYYFKVAAVDWSGNESACSAPGSVYIPAIERGSSEVRLSELMQQ
jgi:hypothetical protein